jgi:trehalose 6-phosphate phosphatase
MSSTTHSMEEQVPAFMPGWALFLDVDGTLLEFAGHPSAVRIPPGLLEMLASVYPHAATPVAIVSGRSIADIDRLFAPLQLPTAGQHGVERRDAGGGLHEPGRYDRLLQQVRSKLQEFTQFHPGLLLEDKGSTLCLHFRMSPLLATEVEAVAHRAAALLGGQYEVQPGKMVFEIRPRAWDKGRAIVEFMTESPFAGRCPVFIGDDATDEHGFLVVNRLGGHSIKVGPGDTKAQWRLPDVAAVVHWLTEYVQWCGAEHG